MVQVPVGDSDATSTLSPVARFDLHATTAAAVAGKMQTTFATVPSGRLWLIERVVISSTSTSPTKALLYADREDPIALLDGTNSGNLDIADNTSPLQVTGSLALLVVWSGASAGAVGNVRVQGTIVQTDGS